MFLQQVPEVQQRGRVRDLLHAEVEPHEPAHRIGVVDRVLDTLIGQVEPHLKQVHPQHRGHRLGLTTSLARPIRVVVRLDQPHPHIPRDRGLHHLQEPLTLGDPSPVAVLDVSERGLLTVHTPIISRPEPPGQTPPRTTEKISASLG